MRIDVGANNKRNDIEERHPSLLGQELLRKSQSQWRGDPADLHDGHEASSDGGTNLMERSSAGNESHGRQVDHVLDGCNLRLMLVAAAGKTWQTTTWHKGDIQSGC